MFEVHPSRIKDFSKSLILLGEDVPNATAYCDTWVRASGDNDGMFANFCSTANQVADQLDQHLRQIKRILPDFRPLNDY
jgi:hypothetical protein